MRGMKIFQSTGKESMGERQFCPPPSTLQKKKEAGDFDKKGEEFGNLVINKEEKGDGHPLLPYNEVGEK